MKRTHNKPHRHSGDELAVTTKLDHATIAELARGAAAEAHGNDWTSPGSVRLEEEGPDSLEFSVRGGSVGGGNQLMTFVLETHRNGEISEIQVRMRTWETVEQRLFRVIPLGPAKMLGLALYQDFMRRMSAGIKGQDPAASVNLTIA